MFRYPNDVNITKVETVKKEIQEEYLCDFCENTCPTEVDVDRHRKTVHKWELLQLLNDVNSFICTICFRTQEDRESLIDHIKVVHLLCPSNASHISREIFICDYCHKLFFNKELLVSHMLYWHSGDKARSNTIECPKCHKNVKLKTLWYHFLCHGIWNASPCPVCLETFANSADVIDHVKVHSGLFLCYICGYESTKECYYKNHMKNHKKNIVIKEEVDVSQYFLPQPLSFTTKYKRSNVFKGISLCNDVRICILCKALCLSEEEMRQHILGDHAPEKENKSKIHMCVCGEQFFNSVLLKQHVFKLKGHHKVLDGAQTIPDATEEIVIEVYEIISDAVDSDNSQTLVINQTTSQEEADEISTALEHMEN